MDGTYLSFLTLITDTITRRLPKIAATIINTIIDAFNINNTIFNAALSSCLSVAFVVSKNIGGPLPPYIDEFASDVGIVDTT